MGDFEVAKVDEEIEKLQAELSQEQQANEMLDHSTKDLRNRISDLNAELEKFGSSGSDEQWKARYSEQVDMNKYLQQQVVMLNEKLTEFKGEIANTGLNNNTGNFQIDDYNEVELKQLIKQLQREKREVDGTLRDLEWQLDTESKSRYRINADIMEYKAGLMEAEGKASNARIVEIKQGKPQSKVTKNPHDSSRTTATYNSLTRPKIATKDRYYGIPDNKRIIDPRKGPMKRTAAAGHLPKIDSRNGNSSVKSSPGPEKDQANITSRGFNSAEEIRKKYAAYPRRSDPLL